MNFKVAYIPIGVPTFHLESAKIEFDKSIELIKKITNNVDFDYPEEMLLSIDKLNNYIANKQYDLIIVQNITFANGAYMNEILKKIDCPVVLWTLREPVIDGTRLRLNSLTGAYSAANVLHTFKRKFIYVFGSPDEQLTKDTIESAYKAAKLKKALKELNILQIGHTPQGFGFGRALDKDISTVFGSNLISIESRELIDMAKSYTDEEIDEYLKDANTRIKGLENIKEENVKDFARLYKAYKEYVDKNKIGALSSRCWPDFFTSFGTPVCSVLGILNDLNVPSACEADTYGALTMFCSQFLTNKPAFFGDPVSMDEKENTITLWHCGMAACSLARKDTGAQAGVHCNRKIGPTLEFGCAPEEKVTICRIGIDEDNKFRVFIATGKAIDKPKQFYGTSIVIQTDNDARKIVESTVVNGWEPHYAVAMGDISKELENLCTYLKIECCKY
ncbi:MAG: fucose isomerase [Clostridia bacterium]|nr:fucose isomerase [Clostridia bacterium]